MRFFLCDKFGLASERNDVVAWRREVCVCGKCVCWREKRRERKKREYVCEIERREKREERREKREERREKRREEKRMSKH